MDTVTEHRDLVASERITLEWASDVTPERIEWLWTDRLPLHDLAVLAGEPGLGKSTTTTELAAKITRGELEGALFGQTRAVLIATAEDHFASVVWGRLKAAGADMDRVASVTVAGDVLSIPGDVDALAATCRQLRADGRPVALIVVDPIAAFLGGVDSHKDAAVRGALAPLAALAQSERVCVLTVAHLNKSTAGKLLERISGSGAFGAAPRSVLAFARDPDDPDGEQGTMRVIVHAKSNHGRYAPTLAVHIEAPMIEEVGATVSRLVIDGQSAIRPDDLRPDNADRSSGSDVREAIISALADGERKALALKNEVASTCGVSSRTVERVASEMEKKHELERRREGQPPVAVWSLAQLRHDQLRHAVATDAVATDNPPQPRAIAGTLGASSDTSIRDVATDIGYRNICVCADGGLDGAAPDRCGRCFGHRGLDAEPTHKPHDDSGKITNSAAPNSGPGEAIRYRNPCVCVGDPPSYNGRCGRCFGYRSATK